MTRRTTQVAGLCYLFSGLCIPPVWAQETPFQCRPLTCSTLTPTASVDDATTNDCAYRAGNLWWVDYVAGSLAWSDREVAKPIIDLMDYVRFQSTVPVRLREFSIMIQGRLWRSQVEWATHYQPAINAGVTPETLTALKANQRPTAMKPDEAAVYDFCMELFTRHAVSDETYGRLHQVLNDQQIVDLAVLQGLYVTAASTMAMVDQGLPPGWDLAFKPGEP